MKIIFEKGIPGFENLHNFELVNIEDREEFKILQSIEEEVSFVTRSPFDIYPEYEINLNDEIINELEIQSPNDVLILSIITLGRDIEKSTMNLKAPIVINIDTQRGKQYILQNENYETKHPLIRREENVSNY